MLVLRIRRTLRGVQVRVKVGTKVYIILHVRTSHIKPKCTWNPANSE